MATTRQRSAGILMHITSLPSAYGIGDLGPEAFDFADFLFRSRQHYWQILPLTPIQEGQGFSPYSSNSSMASNTLLISPDELLKQNLLTPEDVLPFRLPVTDQVNFHEACQLKNSLFEIAYQNSKSKSDNNFELFCNREAYWLDDFALFVSIKNKYKNQPWHEWPAELKNRDLTTLLEFTRNHQEELTKIKWLQYIFNQQWKKLKNYCNSLNIKIVGDLPFYMSHDAADVWSKREIFDLKKDGRMSGVAGVPPDYFNEEGQLWGMPVYKWDVLKSQRYDWWIKRIRKNLELVDLLRLDHFRAFVEFWNVSSTRKTAVKGEWKPGPAEDIFSVFAAEFNDMPFIAEDLGQITDSVYALRDKHELPGMKVIQFAFGNDLQTSPHAPHNFERNYFAYTGTHDNNTTRGWFENEIDSKMKSQISKYIGYEVNAKNVSHALGRLAYSSVAETVIVPLQDLLCLDEQARMNKPASPDNNWKWRLVSDELDDRTELWVKECMEIYGRANQFSSDSA
jgi:4-alpha-glucanotransferase